MKKDNVLCLEKRVAEESRDALEAICREGAREMLAQALQNEVSEYLQQHCEARDENGHRLVVRNGYLPHRELCTGLGPVPIKQPRVHDRRPGCKFSSQILPPFARRCASVNTVIPVLYLKGLSTGDFSEALAALLGPDAPGLSPTNIVRLKASWEQEYQAWCQRDLSAQRYVYVWADGIYFNVRLEPQRPCLLVMIGTLEDGTKHLLGIWDGERESTLSWKEALLDLKQRGLKEAPKLAVGDGALGFWKALQEVFPETREQRCWVHKTANVLDKLPKKLHPQAKHLLHEMYLSDTRKDALGTYQKFLELYEDRYPKACACLEKDRDVLFTFYDFPKEHWCHLRSTNPIESTFATVRHRTRQTKGCGSRMATLSMVFKLGQEAEKSWRRLRGYRLITNVIEGVRFVDGEISKPQTQAA